MIPSIYQGEPAPTRPGWRQAEGPDLPDGRFLAVPLEVHSCPSCERYERRERRMRAEIYDLEHQLLLERPAMAVQDEPFGTPDVEPDRDGLPTFFGAQRMPA